MNLNVPLRVTTVDRHGRWPQYFCIRSGSGRLINTVKIQCQVEKEVASGACVILKFESNLLPLAIVHRRIINTPWHTFTEPTAIFNGSAYSIHTGLRAGYGDLGNGVHPSEFQFL